MKNSITSWAAYSKLRIIRNLIIVILVLAVNQLFSLDTSVYEPELDFGFAYCKPDFSISGFSEGIEFISSKNTTQTYICPFASVKKIWYKKPLYNLSYKVGVNIWQADYLLNLQDEENCVSGIPFESSISCFDANVGIMSSQQMGRLSFSQSISVLVGLLSFSIDDSNASYVDRVVTAGCNGEVGLQIQVTKKQSVYLGAQKQLIPLKDILFKPDSSLRLKGNFSSPNTLLKLGISMKMGI